MKKSLVLGIILIINYLGFSQPRFYEPKEILNAYKKGTRTHNGVPGLNYWQNTISYNLETELNPKNKLLKGSGKIIYTNNSPDTLKYLIIKLLPNIHKKGNARDYTVGSDHLNEGMIIDSFAINNQGQDVNDHKMFREYGTNLYVIFDKPERILPGSNTEFFVSWNYEIIGHGIRNGAYTDSAFFIGYWYPQIAVYDDIYGWDREDYTGVQETYNDLGTYEVKITVPDGYLVWATGDQTNESDIYSSKTLDLIQKSRSSQETIHIINNKSYSKKNIFKNQHKNTWIFKAENVPDFAWACSNYYYWDANSISLENANHQNVWINAVYPPNTASFDKVSDIAHESIDFLSTVFPKVPYPFNKHITFNGIDHVAVEYPMMANNCDHADEEMYTELTIHEIAHNYLPFFVLSNERKHAWIDEGWVKLIGELYGESSGLKRENKKILNTINIYEKLAGSSNDLPLIVPSSFMTARSNFYHSYAKAANADYFLLELLKEKNVKDPLKKFLMTWKGKHPTPYDFFNYMNNLSKTNLDWFWKPWYFEFSSPDLAIKRNDYTNEILVINKGGIPLPINLSVTYQNDSSLLIEKSIWEWAEMASQVAITIPDIENVKLIKLGSPEIPDINYGDNTLYLHDEIIGKR